MQVGESAESSFGAVSNSCSIGCKVCKGRAARVSACLTYPNHAWATGTATARRLAARAALRSPLLSGLELLPLADSGWPPGSGVPPSLQELPSTCVRPSTAQDTADLAPTSSHASAGRASGQRTSALLPIHLHVAAVCVKHSRHNEAFLLTAAADGWHQVGGQQHVVRVVRFCLCQRGGGSPWPHGLRRVRGIAAASFKRVSCMHGGCHHMQTACMRPHGLLGAVPAQRPRVSVGLGQRQLPVSPQSPTSRSALGRCGRGRTGMQGWRGAIWAHTASC